MDGSDDESEYSSEDSSEEETHIDPRGPTKIAQADVGYGIVPSQRTASLPRLQMGQLNGPLREYQRGHYVAGPYHASTSYSNA